MSPDQVAQLRSVVGSLAWVARQGRPDVAYRVSYLQPAINGATVGLLRECNKVVDLARKQLEDVVLGFPREHLKTTDWRNVGIITVTDASFCNEKGFKSQQGRAHLLAKVERMKDEGAYIYHVLPLVFSSTTIKRVRRSTLQAKTSSLQSGIESGDKIRALIGETKGCLRSRKDWESICNFRIAVAFAITSTQRHLPKCQTSDSGLSWPQFTRTCGRDLRAPAIFSRTEEIVLNGSALTHNVE